MRPRRFGVLEEDDSDPMLSSINLVDVFLVAMVMLMAAVANRTLATSAAASAADTAEANGPPQRIVVEQSQRLSRFRTSGATAEGNGTLAGTAYRMNDGTMVYVPSESQLPSETSLPVHDPGPSEPTE
ncbi:DUF2149 domain-containing protein [Roseimaritima sediminicola]|uniref:DUF2149 domain-containing protein n=1 Tax=Roseimaritima sediminicola TaxID=2662066 RepID=UPI0012983106|nr:DUF2149 domain-containing protein [Roseimaritima sediminicola]